MRLLALLTACAALCSAEARIADATYYDLNGRITASGIVMDRLAFTCAHRTLPFGTIIRLVRLDEGSIKRSAKLVVTDRGPFPKKKEHKDREVDVSWGAARHLHMLKAGAARISYKVIGFSKDPIKDFGIRPRKIVLKDKHKPSSKEK